MKRKIEEDAIIASSLSPLVVLPLHTVRAEIVIEDPHGGDQVRHGYKRHRHPPPPGVPILEECLGQNHVRHDVEKVQTKAQATQEDHHSFYHAGMTILPRPVLVPKDTELPPQFPRSPPCLFLRLSPWLFDRDVHDLDVRAVTRSQCHRRHVFRLSCVQSVVRLQQTLSIFLPLLTGPSTDASHGPTYMLVGIDVREDGGPSPPIVSHGVSRRWFYVHYTLTTVHCTCSALCSELKYSSTVPTVLLYLVHFIRIHTTTFLRSFDHVKYEELAFVKSNTTTRTVLRTA